jgi:rubredoxin
MSEFSLKTAREWLFANPTATSVNVNAYVAALDEVERLSAPRAMLLWCPQCNTRHIDKNDFATKPHHTHACQSCGHVWRPAIESTCGVRFLPGFKNADTDEK